VFQVIALDRIRRGLVSSLALSGRKEFIVRYFLLGCSMGSCASGDAKTKCMGTTPLATFFGGLIA